MRKKWGIICVFLTICVICICKVQQKPEAVSCITTMDTTYLTVLMRGNWFADKREAAQEIIEMCENNSFDDIKLSIWSEQGPEIFYITVYKNKTQMNKGIVWMTIIYNCIEGTMKVL